MEAGILTTDHLIKVFVVADNSDSQGEVHQFFPEDAGINHLVLIVHIRPKSEPTSKVLQNCIRLGKLEL
jgi:hypothetical protein